MRSATSFPLPHVAIWRNVDAYLAAFGGQVPEAGFETADDRARPTRARVARSQIARCRLRCGHSDSVTVQRLVPDITYPRVPGHEVIGMVEAIGPDVLGWDVGMRSVRVAAVQGISVATV